MDLLIVHDGSFSLFCSCPKVGMAKTMPDVLLDPAFVNVECGIVLHIVQVPMLVFTYFFHT